MFNQACTLIISLDNFQPVCLFEQLSIRDTEDTKEIPSLPSKDLCHDLIQILV